MFPHPRTGGRVVLDLVRAGSSEIVYDAAIYTPAELFQGRAAVTADTGAVTWTNWQPAAPPAWLIDAAAAFLRVEWRARRAADPPPWPSRINRWRDEKPA
jgi:hypothetical protein